MQTRHGDAEPRRPGGYSTGFSGDPAKFAAAVEKVIAAALDPDPDLRLVTADLSVWLAAHPCDCEGVCTCESS